MNVMPCMKGFLPSGKDALIAAALVGFICACGVYTYEQVVAKIETESTAVYAIQAASPFNTKNACIPKEHILHGGVRKDAIPSLTHPNMITAESATYLDGDDRVIGVVIHDHALAFPLRILAWHECVNETVGDSHFAVIYCPLCDSTCVFNREIDDEVLEFGISGKLYQSNVLLYDRQSNPRDESLWSQMEGRAVCGPKVNTQLKTIPHVLVTWMEWKTMYPNTEVLSNQTGYKRDYIKQYYPNYFASSELMFPIYKKDNRFQLKDEVIGIRYQGKAKAYPIKLMDFTNGKILDRFAGKTVTFSQTKAGDVLTDADEELEVYHSFWFAWYAFHPHTEIYSVN